MVAQCGKDNPFLKIYSNSNLYPTDFNNQRDRKIFTNLCDATSYSNKIIMNPWEKYGSVYRTIQLRNNNEKEEILFWCSEGKFVDGFNAEEYDRRKVYDPYKTIPSLEQLKIYLARNVCTPYDLR